MTSSLPHGPFGRPAVTAEPRVHGLARGRVIAADVLCERLRRSGAAGVGLLARRADGGGAGGGGAGSGSGETLVAARNLLRVELRGELATVTALEPDARPLLPLLAERLGDVDAGADRLRLRVPAERAAPGTPDDEVLRAPGCFDVLRAVAGLIADSRPGAPVPPGLLGAFGYELVDRWEDLGPRNPDPLDEPDFSFVLVGDAVHYDRDSDRVTVVVRGLPWERAAEVAARADRLVRLLGDAPGDTAGDAAPRRQLEPADVAPAPFEPGFGAAVETLLRHIAAGDVYQAVLSRSVALPAPAPPVAVLRALNADAPWRFLVDLGDGTLVGASPETCLRVEGGEVEIRPLAGTVPRGIKVDGTIDPDLDRRLGVQLLLDDKEQAEHAMLVDLARNDVARVSEPGTTQLTESFALLRMPRVQHLASRVTGRLRPGLDALHAYRAVANMGTLTGAPKPMAMTLVRRLETTARGFYGGAVAFLGGDGTLRSCIAIRMLRHEPAAGVYHARAGAGIVHDSVPAAEFAETEHKLSQLRRAAAEAMA